MGDNEFYNARPIEYTIKLYKAKIKLLERGFGLSCVEGKSLSELENLIDNSFEIRISPSVKIIVVKDENIPPNKMYLNGLEIKLGDN